MLDLMPDAFESGRLHYGVELHGGLHVEYTIGSVRTADRIVLDVAGKSIDPADEPAMLRHGLRSLSARLRKLGDLPRATLTPEFLEQHLEWPDVLLMWEAASRLDQRLEDFRAQLEAQAQAHRRAGAADRVEPA